MKTITYNKPHKTPSSPNANTNKFKLYRIVWRDAYTQTDEWHDETTINQEDYLCETTGYLIEHNTNPNYYTIASTITQEGYYCSLINIPINMVIKKERLHTKS
jgi:hypothetical protein